MSSFLMNTGSYDPKFMGEEYGQGYPGMVHNPSDYYNQSAAAASVQYSSAYSQMNASQQAQAASLAAYGAASARGVAAAAADPMGYGGYYGAQCGISPHQQHAAAAMHMAAAAQYGVGASPAALNHHLSNASRSSPVSPQPPPPPNPQLTPSSLSSGMLPEPHGHGGGGGGSSGGSSGGGAGPDQDSMPGYGHHSPPNSHLPGSGGQGQLNQGSGGAPGGGGSSDHLLAESQLTPGGGDGMSSDGSDDEGSPGGEGGAIPTVYPWMKKIHISGLGELSCTNVE